MRHYVLRCEMEAPVPVEQAFRVFEDPYNLARITPPWLSFRVVNLEHVSMRKGAEIDYTIKWLGVPMKWKTLISDYHPPFVFVDTQEKGPYVWWHHTHAFTPTVAGTRVTDEVRYILPMGALGRAAHTLVVGRQLKQIFEYRRKMLPTLIGGDLARYRTSDVSVVASGG
jgi:ligand-binding SRPBCC domain-containing protein